jgi:tripartite-type tricarboxylate transporter receptor subunit TctC
MDVKATRAIRQAEVSATKTMIERTQERFEISTDVAARVIGEYLSRALGQQIVVENKSGANGNIGLETAARSAADGYTVLVAPDAGSSNPHVYKMNVDPLKGLTPVIQLSRQPIVLAAHSSLGVASLAELIVLARCLDENNSKGRARI